MENPESGTPKHDAGRFVSLQRLPYNSPALIEYGKVSKLTEGIGSKQRRRRPGMMMPPCL